MTDEKKEEPKKEVKDETAEETPAETASEAEVAETPAEEVKEEPQPKADQPMAEKVKETPAPEEKKEEKKEPSGKFKDLIKTIESLTALELSELVKELEERFGVSAATPIAMAGAVSDGATGGEVAEEKIAYTVILAAAGVNKIAAIKAVREVTDLGLKEAKDLIESAPKEIKANVPTDEAQEMKKKLEEAGATVELK